MCHTTSYKLFEKKNKNICVGSTEIHLVNFEMKFLNY